MSDPGHEYWNALDATKKHHKQHKTFSGRFLFRYLDDVKRIIDGYDCETMLDYGCGKGVQYEQPMDSGEMIPEYLGVDITKYDPGVEKFSQEPKGKFDLVICTQVLGSVPISGLPWVVDRLYGFASKAVYVAERIRPVKKQLHKHMEEAMPRMWPHDKWAELLRRPGSEVACWLRTKDYTAQNTTADNPMPKRLENVND